MAKKLKIELTESQVEWLRDIVESELGNGDKRWHAMAERIYGILHGAAPTVFYLPDDPEPVKMVKEKRRG